MRGVFIFAVMLVSAMPVWAQWGNAARQTFTNEIVSEDTGGNGPVTPTATVSGTAAVSSPFVIRGVVVTISETSGFARDLALEKAASQGLATALRGLEMSAEEATGRAKSVGDAMQFVASYSIVKEALVPVYTLTTDLTFDAEKLRKNFGGVVGTVQVVSGTGVSGTVMVPAVPVPGQRFIVRLENPDPVAQDNVLKKLAALPRAQAKYRVIASNGAEFEVITSGDEGLVEEQLRGSGAVVVKGLRQPVADVPVSPTAEAPKMPVASGPGDPSVGEMMWPMRDGSGAGAE